MTMTDPIADLLTRIRNGNRRALPTVDVPSSRIKREMVRLLREERFIDNYTLIEDNKQGILRIYLRYGPHKARIVRNLKRISRPGRRVYVNRDQLPRVLGGIGVALISTSRGLLTDRQARKEGVGGEVLCYVW